MGQYKTIILLILVNPECFVVVTTLFRKRATCLDKKATRNLNTGILIFTLFVCSSHIYIIETLQTVYNSYVAFWNVSDILVTVM